MIRNIFLLAVILAYPPFIGFEARGCTEAAGQTGEQPGAVENIGDSGREYKYEMCGHSWSDDINSHCLASMPVLWAYIKWIANDATGSGWTDFVMDGEYAYRLRLNDQALTRFSLRTGEVSPFIDLDANPAASTFDIRLVGDTIFLGGHHMLADKPEGVIYAMSIKEEKMKWVYRPDAAKCATVVMILPDDRMIAVVGDAPGPDTRVIALGGKISIPTNLVCLRQSTGEVLWTQPNEGGGLVLCGKQLVRLNENGIYALDLNDGHVLWRTPIKDPVSHVDGLRLITDGKMVFAKTEGEEYGIIAFDGATGKEVWRVEGVYGSALDGKGHILVMEQTKEQNGKAGSTLLLDAATGQVAVKLPITLLATHVVGDWAYAMDAGWTDGPPAQILGAIEVFNVKTGETKILVDGRLENAPLNPAITVAETDGYIITDAQRRSGKRGWYCLEDMRFHPDATKMLFDLRPEMLDDKMKARIAELIDKLADPEPEPRKKVKEEILTYMDLAEEQCAAAVKDPKNGHQWEALTSVMDKIKEWMKLRKYIDDLGCWRDPIYFTVLIRHTADLQIQQKAIDRLKQITGQDFGLKPSAEWVKDQKEASDKYDNWWQDNRDKLAWSEKDDKYVEK